MWTNTYGRLTVCTSVVWCCYTFEPFLPRCVPTDIKNVKRVQLPYWYYIHMDLNLACCNHIHFYFYCLCLIIRLLVQIFVIKMISLFTSKHNTRETFAFLKNDKTQHGTWPYCTYICKLNGTERTLNFSTSKSTPIVALYSLSKTLWQNLKQTHVIQCLSYRTSI